jgi:hypothetical protein
MLICIEDILGDSPYFTSRFIDLSEVFHFKVDRGGVLAIQPTTALPYNIHLPALAQYGTASRLYHRDATVITVITPRHFTYLGYSITLGPFRPLAAYIYAANPRITGHFNFFLNPRNQGDAQLIWIVSENNPLDSELLTHINVRGVYVRG